MEMVNALRAVNCTERRIVKEMVIMLAPFAPHFAEECWERLGADLLGLRGILARLGGVAHPGPGVEIPVQVNGKTRARIRVPRGAEEPAVVKVALGDPQVRKFFDGEKPDRVVYVKDRLLNLVAN